jgi:hypothetical protein
LIVRRCFIFIFRTFNRWPILSASDFPWLLSVASLI